MKTLLLFFISLSALAQTNIPVRLDITGYRGNVVQSVPIALNPADTLLPLSVVATYSSAPGSLTLTPQPTLVRTGLSVVVRFATSSALPQSGWYRLYSGTQVRFDGPVNIITSGVIPATIPGTVLAGINSSIAVLQGQYSALTSFTATNASTLASLSAGIAANGAAIAAANTRINSVSATAASAVQSSTYTANRTTDQNALTTHATNTANPHAVTAAQVGAYTQAQVSTLLQGYYLPVPVGTKAAAVAAATGTQPKIITVAVDESDGNRKNKYIYDGDNAPLSYPLF